MPRLFIVNKPCPTHSHRSLIPLAVAVAKNYPNLARYGDADILFCTTCRSVFDPDNLSAPLADECIIRTTQ